MSGGAEPKDPRPRSPEFEKKDAFIMSLPTAKTLSDSTLGPLWLLLRDFATFAGTKGLKAFLFVFLGAVVEGVGLVLLIPFFSVIIDSQNTGGWVAGCVRVAVRVVLRGEPSRKIKRARRVVRNADGC